MSLNVTGSEIQIKNSAGQTKFTSNNKLIWEKYYRTGSHFIQTTGAGGVGSQGFSSLDLRDATWNAMGGMRENDFALINIKILSSTGAAAVTGGLINKEMPANGSIIVNFIGQNVSQQPAATTEILCVDLTESFLNFRVVRFDYNQNWTYGSLDMTMSYKVRIWSYL